jgi:hypothetical protein
MGQNLKVMHNLKVVAKGHVVDEFVVTQQRTAVGHFQRGNAAFFSYKIANETIIILI